MGGVCVFTFQPESVGQPAAISVLRRLRREDQFRWRPAGGGDSISRGARGTGKDWDPKMGPKGTQDKRQAVGRPAEVQAGCWGHWAAVEGTQNWGRRQAKLSVSILGCWGPGGTQIVAGSWSRLWWGTGVSWERSRGSPRSHSVCPKATSGHPPAVDVNLGSPRAPTLRTREPQEVWAGGSEGDASSNHFLWHLVASGTFASFLFCFGDLFFVF